MPATQVGIRATAVFAAAVVLACGGCSVDQVVGAGFQHRRARRIRSQIHGDASDPVNKIVVKAIADLQTYWGDEFRKLYGKDFEPVKGGLSTRINRGPLASSVCPVSRRHPGHGAVLCQLRRGRMGRRRAVSRLAGSVRRLRHSDENGPRMGTRGPGAEQLNP